MEAPRLPSFFKSPRAKQFVYRPFYYDKQKEERELRKKRYDGELKEAGENEDVPYSYQSNLREKWQNSSSIGRSKTNSNQRLILIILALLGLVWLFYKDLI